MTRSRLAVLTWSKGMECNTYDMPQLLNCDVTAKQYVV